MTSIKSIKKLSDFGIFKSHSDVGLKDFGKKNLIFGWNGSGKSTLSRLFEIFENKQALHSGPFAESKFIISTDDGNLLNEANFASSTLNIRTFNQQFIKANIQWDKSVKGLLLVSSEKIQEKKNLEDLKKKQAADESDLQIAVAATKAKEDGIEEFLTASAKRTRTNLQVIDTKDNRYLNYDKRKLRDTLAAQKAQIEDSHSILSVERVAALTAAARPDLKADPTLPTADISFERFEKAHERLQNLLNTTAANLAIDRLTKNPDLQSWVSQGLSLHQTHQSADCEFCGHQLSPERKQQLANHFNKQYEELQTRLTSASTWLLDQKLSADSWPAESELYDEFKPTYAAAKADFLIQMEDVNLQIQAWQNALEEKTRNQARTDLIIEEIKPDTLTNLQIRFNAATAQINLHRKKTANFQTETDIAKRSLEIHYAATEASSFGYYSLLAEVAAEKKQNEDEKSRLATIRQTILTLQNSLSDQGLGATEFNKSLHRFLGRSELSLQFDSSGGGYKIIRQGKNDHDSNLSEGEKTAVAFVYFITKLTEQDNKIANTIVVIDDPISSFDSNHLFFAYSYLRTNCESAKQLIVFTHNFNFYRLVRDWYDGSNKNRQNNGKDPNCHFYLIEANSSNPRSSIMREADDSLTRYSSEYHYLFKRLHLLGKQPTLPVDDAYIAATLTRKLLETFFTFKFPARQSDLASLLTRGLTGCTETTVDQKERIYRFINKYSHSDSIEFGGDAVENLLGEGTNILQSVFKWMNEVDASHTSEMIAMAEK